MHAIHLLPSTTPLPCATCRKAEPASDQPCPCALHDEALEALVMRAAGIDPEGYEHTLRVGRIAAMLAEAMGIAEAEREVLERAAALHDIGKLALPAGVLDHRHVLDPAARRVMERHTVLGAALLAHARAPWLRLAAEIAGHHHERWDGSGYPAGLAGEAIPLAARLVAVADVYDALRSERPYKSAQDHPEAMRRILEGDGRIAPAQFDPAVLAALKACSAALAAMPRSGFRASSEDGAGQALEDGGQFALR
jgi:putative two-component system response regulator